MEPSTTRLVALYARQSKGDPDGIDRQLPRTAALAEMRGWTVVDRYADDDVSASKPRGAGTGWARMLDDARAGRINTVIAVDLDRLLRTTRDLNTLIDHGLMAVTVDGEIDLSTADGEFRATMLAGIARFEVRRKGERQTRAQQQRAEQGRPPKGVRLTGYTITGEVVPAEAELVRRLFRQFLAGDTLKGLAAQLESEGVPTRRGGRWSSSTVATILRNARYAGRSVYKGEDVGAAAWPALVSEDVYAAVQARLDDPRRRTRGESTARKHLGSGLYYCTCGLRVRSSSGMGSGLHRYTCRNFCHYRSGRPIDEYVVGVVRARLGQPDLRELLARPVDEGRLAELAKERTRLRESLARTEADYDADLIDGRRYRTKTEKLHTELAAVRSEEARLLADAGPDAVLTADDPVGAFDAAPLGIQRQVVDALLTVTLHKGRHGSRTFDPSTVELVWRGAQS